ncbi:MAG: hypothetical protein GY869_18435, partial [Planctomycetes bacterium]|nr:hypothetical protein [Planctomycetota bacterium]
GFVGFDDFELYAQSIEVAYNAASGSTNDNIVANFGASPYIIDTGNGELTIDYSTKLLSASVALAELRISDYVFIKGSLAFEKGPSTTVRLSNGGSKLVDTLKVGADDVSMFFGVNGPYWEDLDGNGDVDTDETSDDAIGLHITDASLALALMTPSTPDGIKYLGLTATASELGFVGVDIFEFGASRVVVNLNLAIGGNDTTPVVDFSEFADEILAVFDAEDNGITVDELRTLSGQNAYSSDNGDLYSDTDSGLDGVELDRIVAILDLDNDG